MKSIIKSSSFIFLFAIIFFVSCKKESSCEGCKGNNKPPIANAGPDQVILLPTDSVLLDARASRDPDGILSSYLWTKISGPSSFNISKPADSVTKVKSLMKGTYLFELKVTDNGGLFSKDTMQIAVNDASELNHPPVANAGPDQTITLPNNIISLDGSGSTDPDNNITSYAWAKISGPSSFSILNANVSQTQVTNLAEGVYQFELKVTDAGGLLSKDTLLVTVNPSTTPLANAGADIIITLPLDSVYLSMGVYEPQTIYQWSQISGPSTSVITNYAFTISPVPNIALVKQLVPGVYSFRLTANNPAGTSVDTVNVLVIDNPSDLNTITFLDLKWILADEYGLGLMDLSLRVPAVPNLFSPSLAGAQWNLNLIQVYLQIDPPAGSWMTLNATQPGPVYYSYDSALPHIWIMRLPVDNTWVGKKSTVKIKLL
jgi:hypothetical protein